MKIKIEVTDGNGRVFVGETELFEPKQTPHKPSAGRLIEIGKVPSLPERILRLRNQGFFSMPKTYPEVHKELAKEYHCEPNRVRVALGRLQTKKQLRKASATVEGNKVNAYTW